MKQIKLKDLEWVKYKGYSPSFTVGKIYEIKVKSIQDDIMSLIDDFGNEDYYFLTTRWWLPCDKDGNEVGIIEE